MDSGNEWLRVQIPFLLSLRVEQAALNSTLNGNDNNDDDDEHIPITSSRDEP